MKNILFTVLLLLIGYCSYQGFQLHHLQKVNTETKEDFAEIRRINYGLFNADLWKEKALNIFGDKISTFELNPEIYEEVDKQLELYLYDVYNEYFESGKLMDMIVEEASKSGSRVNKMFLNLIKDNVGDYLKQMNLRSKIPGIASSLSAELKKNEPTIKKYLKEELDEMLFADVKDVIFKDPRESIYSKYDGKDLESTSVILKEKITEQDHEIRLKIRWLYIFLLITILAAAFLYKLIEFKYLIVSFTLTSIVMLALGVTQPMIDIDARLNDFEFTVLNNDIKFDEQVLYYQSKSILDVTRTLLEGRGIDLKIVGLLILMFSIVFPFFKLILSTLYLYVGRVRNSKLARTIIFYLGKWSMADVFVVAMFMAYIGFYGLVTSQLGEIATNRGGYAVETVNYSKLSPGALFFTSYCILSIITSLIIDKVEQKKTTIEV